MLVHGLLLERVDLRGLGGSAGGNDVLGERCDRCPEAPGEKELGALRRKGACDRAAYASFVPSVHVDVDAEGAAKVVKLIDALEDCDDVQNVFANFDLSDDVSAALDEE